MKTFLFETDFKENIPTWVLFVLLTILALSLIYISWTDLKERIIPNYITLPGIFISAGLSPVLYEDWKIHLIFGAISAVLFIGLAFIKIRGKYAFGMGDAKLYTMAGFILGGNLIFCMLFSSLAGILVVIVWFMLKPGEAPRAIPHGPQIALGILVTLGLSLLLF